VLGAASIVAGINRAVVVDSAAVADDEDDDANGAAGRTTRSSTKHVPSDSNVSFRRTVEPSGLVSLNIVMD
jgi:hypothetical protein